MQTVKGHGVKCGRERVEEGDADGGTHLPEGSVVYLRLGGNKENK